jgi:hypothetical protein
MGNIDDPNSEAYRRLGAGRGRAERAARVPVEDVTPIPVPESKITSRSEGMEGVNASIQARKNAEAEGEKISEGERIAQAMASKPSVASEASKPKPKPMAKPAPKPAVSEQVEQPKPKVESIMKQKPVSTAATFDAYSLNNFAAPKAEEKKPSSTYKKNATYGPSGKKYGPSGKKADTSKSTEGNDVDFGGTGLGMKRGGSVGKASSRADGIAQRGKTRGKMC